MSNRRKFISDSVMVALGTVAGTEILNGKVFANSETKKKWSEVVKSGKPFDLQVRIYANGNLMGIHDFDPIRMVEGDTLKFTYDLVGT